MPNPGDTLVRITLPLPLDVTGSLLAALSSRYPSSSVLAEQLRDEDDEPIGDELVIIIPADARLSPATVTREDSAWPAFEQNPDAAASGSVTPSDDDAPTDPSGDQSTAGAASSSPDSKDRSPEFGATDTRDKRGWKFSRKKNVVPDPIPTETKIPITATEVLLTKIFDGRLGISMPEWFGAMFVSIAKQILDDQEAPNYIEVSLTDGKQTYPVFLCRPDRPNPHELREQAEAKVERYEAKLRDLGLDPDKV